MNHAISRHGHSHISVPQGVPPVGITQNPAPSDADAPAAAPDPRAVADAPRLPVTGSPVQSLLILAVSMIGVGVALLALYRRRTRRGIETC